MRKQHLPLHVKYRPQNFNHIIGQTKITKYLELSIKKKKVTFAYLFAGQHGSGKTTVARIMAKALNCVSLDTIPCNKCDNRLNIHSGRSFDFYEIDAAKNTGIENIRDIIEKIQFAPIMSKYKVCIIDEAHMLSHSAFNSLLKTLESPPLNTIFILSTTSVNKIPNTIVSRCQRLYFQPIQNQDLIIAISKITHYEGLKITNEGISSLLNIAKGSMRDALNVIDFFTIENEPITAKSLSDRYLIPPTIIIDKLIEKLLFFNLFEVLAIITYIEFHNWNTQMIIDYMYNKVIKSYVKNKKLHSQSNVLFLNTDRLINLLQLLIKCKFAKENDCWLYIVSFVLKYKNRSISMAKKNKRTRIHVYYDKTKIYSN